MEISDVAQALWKKYDLPWQNDARQATEWYAKAFVRGVLNPHRRLEFVGEQGANKVTTLRYVERGYGPNGGFGGITFHYGCRAAVPACSYEVTPQAYAEFAERLGSSGQLGKQFQGSKPLRCVKDLLIGELVIASPEIVVPFFSSFIDYLPLSGRAQQQK